MEYLGEVGNHFSSLERLLEQFIHALSGEAADRHWSFRRKCRRIRALLKPIGKEAYETDVGGWLDDCEEAADERNEASHTPRVELREDREKTPIAVEQLAALKALKARIIALHSHGTVYKDELSEVLERKQR